ncbi:MAG: PEP-CTERM sorting domain-containing protein, partial [Nostoc sp. DedQUE12b]|uniref:PEP-CTERM sorting domain-containing protein n=1 Tax=Nostoc sp. DedQUE12b TaxID=3075398 RepID=UPI002AD36136
PAPTPAPAPAPVPSVPPYYQPPAPQPKKVPEPSTTAALGLFTLGFFGLKKKNKKNISQN